MRVRASIFAILTYSAPSFTHHSRIIVAALLSLFFTTSVSVCGPCEDEQCVPVLGCGCVRRIGCIIPVPLGTPRDSPVPISTIPLPQPIQTELDKLGAGASRMGENLGGDKVSAVLSRGAVMANPTFSNRTRGGGTTYIFALPRVAEIAIRSLSHSLAECVASRL